MSTTHRPTHEEVVDATADLAATMHAQRVPVNAYESPGAFVVVAPLPAVVADDVTVELNEGSIRFWAELRSAGPREFVVHEWEYGGYERTVDIPAGYGSGVEATLSNGQLAIRVLSGEPVGLLRIRPA